MHLPVVDHDVERLRSASVGTADTAVAAAVALESAAVGCCKGSSVDVDTGSSAWTLPPSCTASGSSRRPMTSRPGRRFNRKSLSLTYGSKIHLSFGLTLEIPLH